MLKSVESVYVFLSTRGFFYCLRNWCGAHIDTGVIGFLNGSDHIFVKLLLH